MDTAVIKSSEGYDVLLSSISNLWSEAKERAIVAVNAELIRHQLEDRAVYRGHLQTSVA